ncbi:MAG: hypothetical protein QM645_09710 [Asticcacaulis sp.]
MKTQISKIALVSAFGAALAFSPAMAQDAAAPAEATAEATAPAAPEAEASNAVSVTGTVAAVEANGSYTVTVPTQSGSVRDIAVDASAAAAAETLSVGDEVTIVGTLDAEQTKLTASSITKAAAEEAAPAAPAEQPAE